MAWTRISLALTALSLLLGGCQYHIYEVSRDDEDCAGWLCDHDDDDGIDEAMRETLDGASSDAATGPDGGMSDASANMCTDDLSCEAGMRCDAGECVAAGCARDSECEIEHVCLEAACRAQADTCQFDHECGAGRGCVDHACRAFCAADDECGPGEACNGARCAPRDDECTEGAECGAGQACVASRCLPTCAEDLDCGADARCDIGVCRPDVAPRPFCEDDEGCAEGHLCVAGVCRTPCVTGTDDECLRWDRQLVSCAGAQSDPALLLCFTRNESHPECAGPEDCLDGQRCVDAICRNP